MFTKRVRFRSMFTLLGTEPPPPTKRNQPSNKKKPTEKKNRAKTNSLGTHAHICSRANGKGIPVLCFGCRKTESQCPVRATFPCKSLQKNGKPMSRAGTGTGTRAQRRPNPKPAPAPASHKTHGRPCCSSSRCSHNKRRTGRSRKRDRKILLLPLLPFLARHLRNCSGRPRIPRHSPEAALALRTTGNHESARHRMTCRPLMIGWVSRRLTLLTLLLMHQVLSIDCCRWTMRCLCW